MFKKSYEVLVNSKYYGKYSFVVQADSIVDALEVARRSNLFQPLDNERDVYSCKEIEAKEEKPSISFENTTNFDKPITCDDILKDIQVSTFSFTKNENTEICSDTKEECDENSYKEYHETEEDYKIYEQPKKSFSNKIVVGIFFLAIGFFGFSFVENLMQIISFFKQNNF